MEYINEEAIYSKDFKNPIYIVLMHSGTPLANAIKKVTKDEYSHAAIAFNAKLDPLYSFGTKGKGESGIGFSITAPTDSFFKDFKSKYAVYVMYVNNKAYSAMKERLEYFKKNNAKMKYDFLGLLDIWFGKATEDHEYKYFCSRFVMEIINQAQSLSKVPSLWKPNDIRDLSNISLIAKGDNFREYNMRDAINVCNGIKNGLYNSLEISHESVDLTIEKDYEEQPEDKLSRYTKMKLSDAVLMNYGRNFPSIRNIRINKDTKGLVWVNGGDLVALVNTTEKEDDDFRWITSLEVFGVHKGKGLSKGVVQAAISELKATNVKVNKDNEIAVKVLKKNGFKTYKKNGDMLLMSRDSRALDEASKNIQEAIHNNELEPGDDINMYLKDHNIELKTIGIKDRLDSLSSNESSSEINEAYRIKGREYKLPENFGDYDNSIRRERPTGKQISSNTGGLDLYDTRQHSDIAAFDIEKQKALLESDDIVKEYNAWVELQLDAIDVTNKEKYATYTGLERSICQDLLNMYDNRDKLHITSVDQIKKYIKNTYFELSDDPQMIKTGLRARLHYNQKITQILQKMIRVNYKNLGLSEEEANRYINTLSQNSNQSNKAAGEILDKLMADYNKYATKKSNTTIIDFSSLGFGSIYICKIATCLNLHLMKM